MAGMVRFRGPHGDVVEVWPDSAEFERYNAHARWVRVEVPPAPPEPRVTHTERAAMLGRLRELGVQVDVRTGVRRLRELLDEHEPGADDEVVDEDAVEVVGES